MMITQVGPASTEQGGLPVASGTDALPLVADRKDVVDISQAARALLAGQMAVSHPAALLSNEQVPIKMGLLRTFLEILFGRKESETTTPQQDVAQAVLEKPVTEAAIQTLRDNGWVA